MNELPPSMQGQLNKFINIRKLIATAEESLSAKTEYQFSSTYPDGHVVVWAHLDRRNVQRLQQMASDVYNTLSPQATETARWYLNNLHEQDSAQTAKQDESLRRLLQE